MTEPTRTIKIYEKTHPKLKIRAATTGETMMDLIERLIQQEIKTMNSTYYVNEEMLGQFATEQDAQHMVSLLQERGYNAEYGTQMNKVKPIPDEVWFECLEQVSTFMQMADDTSNQ